MSTWIDPSDENVPHATVKHDSVAGWCLVTGHTGRVGPDRFEPLDVAEGADLDAAVRAATAWLRERHGLVVYGAWNHKGRVATAFLRATKGSR